MSKLADMIEARQTGRIKTLPSGLTIVGVDDGCELRANGVYKEYRLGVTLTVKAHAATGSQSELIRLKEMCKKQILQEVFGEFQPLIRHLERAIYELDFEKARALVLELDNEMR